VAVQPKPASSSRSQAQRIGRLRLSFSALKADALLVTHLPNIRYLCGFTGSAGLLLVDSARATLFTDSRYTFQAREEVTGARVQIASGGLLAAAGKVLKRHRRLARLALAPSQLSVAQLDALQTAIGKRIRWVKAPNAVEQLRAVKDESELAAIRDAAVLIGNVFQQTVPKIHPGISELDLSAEIEYAMKREGALGPSFETIVAAGPRSAWAHARPTSKPLAKNELVVLDQGAILRGYCSDMTRTVFLGRPSEKVRDMYSAVLEAQAAAKSAIRPGVTAGDVDAAARKVLKARRLDRYFTHSTGHGLGIEVHEIPRLGRGDNTVLQQGMVLTVEPGVYIEGLGGVRIEDDVVVTSNGAVDLTTAPRELLEL
jgi:Xaa-Pro aminopeptidase